MSYKWYTPSGLLARLIHFMAMKWSATPNEYFFVAVLAYGMVDMFGITRSIKIVRRFHDLQVKKARAKSRVGSGRPTSVHVDGGGPKS